jgi:DNA-binding CsgD family transcriptional regulator
MSLVRLVHLTSALLWPAAAALGSWRVRGLRSKRARRRVYLLMGLGIAVGTENLAEALSPVHPSSVAHLLAEAMLAMVGVVALYLIAAYGDELVMEERVVEALAGRSAAAPEGPDVPDVPARALTVRELQVLECLCQGLSAEEIARRMSISPHTATTHIRNLLRKVGVHSRPEAVAWAVRRRLYDPSTGHLGAVELDLLAQP